MTKASYCFQNGAVLETRPDGGQRLFRPWGQNFGVGARISTSDPFIDVTPLFPLIGPGGGLTANSEEYPEWDAHTDLRHFWRDPALPKWARDTVDFSAHDAEPAISRYVATLPGSLRAFIAPFIAWQWIVLDAVCHVAGFSAYANKEIRRNGPAYLIAVLALSHCASWPQDRRRSYLADIIGRTRPAVIEKLSGLTCNSLMLRILEKISPPLETESDIYAFLELLQNRMIVKSLRHVTSLHPDCLYVLPTLPLWTLSPQFARLVFKSSEMPVDIPLLGAFSEKSNLLKILTGRERAHLFRQLTKNASDASDLARRIDAWIVRTGARLAFPPAPFSGSRALVPISTLRELHDESRMMLNCTRTYLSQIISGDVYFYHWFGEEHATVLISLNDQGHWEIVEMAGLGNGPPSGNTAKDITNEFMKLTSCSVACAVPSLTVNSDRQFGESA